MWPYTVFFSHKDWFNAELYFYFFVRSIPIFLSVSISRPKSTVSLLLWVLLSDSTCLQFLCTCGLHTIPYLRNPRVYSNFPSILGYCTGSVRFLRALKELFPASTVHISCWALFLSHSELIILSHSELRFNLIPSSILPNAGLHFYFILCFFFLSYFEVNFFWFWAMHSISMWILNFFL
jgi:hypothetical protein